MDADADAGIRLTYFEDADVDYIANDADVDYIANEDADADVDYIANEDAMWISIKMRMFRGCGCGYPIHL